MANLADIAAIHLRLGLLGIPLPEEGPAGKAVDLVRPILARQRELNLHAALVPEQFVPFVDDDQSDRGQRGGGIGARQQQRQALRRRDQRGREPARLGGPFAAASALDEGPPHAGRLQQHHPQARPGPVGGR